MYKLKRIWFVIVLLFALNVMECVALVYISNAMEALSKAVTQLQLLEIERFENARNEIFNRHPELRKKFEEMESDSINELEIDLLEGQEFIRDLL